LLLRPELYAIPALLGCSLFTLVLSYFPEQRIPGALLCMLLTFAIRGAAIRWDLKAPGFVDSSS
jgi:uncharacterized membrane protein YeiH